MFFEKMKSYDPRHFASVLYLQVAVGVSCIIAVETVLLDNYMLIDLIFLYLYCNILDDITSSFTQKNGASILYIYNERSNSISEIALCKHGFHYIVPHT